MLPRFNKPSHVFQPVPPHSALVSGSLDHFLRKARVAYPYAVLRRWVGRASLSMTPLFAVSILSSEAAPPAPTLPAGEPLAESGRSAAASAERVGSLNVQPGLQIKFLDQRPRIDGLLDEPGWQQAAVLNDFKQVEPREGAEPTEQTEVRVFHNKDYLWIGIMCFDRDPGAVIGREMQRDADSDSDDLITLVFDPFRGKRTGYQSNPVSFPFCCSRNLATAKGLTSSPNPCRMSVRPRNSPNWDREVIFWFCNGADQRTVSCFRRMIRSMLKPHVDERASKETLLKGISISTVHP